MPDAFYCTSNVTCMKVLHEWNSVYADVIIPDLQKYNAAIGILSGREKAPN